MKSSTDIEDAMRAIHLTEMEAPTPTASPKEITFERCIELAMENLGLGPGVSVACVSPWLSCAKWKLLCSSGYRSHNSARPFLNDSLDDPHAASISTGATNVRAPSLLMIIQPSVL